MFWIKKYIVFILGLLIMNLTKNSVQMQFIFLNLIFQNYHTFDFKDI